MLVLLLTLAHADYDYEYTDDSGASPCTVPANCVSCVTCRSVDCELEQEALGKTRECLAERRSETISVWCDCTKVPGDDDDTTTTDPTDPTEPTGDDDDGGTDPDPDETDGTSDPVPTMEPDEEDAKAGGCGCSAAAVDGPAAVFGMLAMLSGGMLMRRRR